MVIGHHIILTGYGHWLPNDPRGSMSHDVFSKRLADLADAHFGRKNPQPTREQLRAFHRQAAERLAYQVLWFESPERQAIANAFEQVIRAEQLTCYACAVLTDHAHLLIRRHCLQAEQMFRPLKDAARDALHLANMALPDHPIFSADSCHLYKSTPESMHKCVNYIKSNSPKHNLPAPTYNFVTPYDNWPATQTNLTRKSK